MAQGQLNLLDLAIRNGNEQVEALIEGVTTWAPELREIPSYPRSGITYQTRTRTALPSGDFGNVGAGQAPQKSEWSAAVGSMCKFEAQMRLNEDIVTIAMGEDNTLVEGDILSDEAMAYMRGSAIRIGSQFWYGQKVSAAGFAGLSTQVDPANQITAGGNVAADSSSVYLVYYPASSINPDGVHFLVGNNGKMSFADTWLKQQVTDPNDATKLMNAYCNSFLSFMGLVVTRSTNVYRVTNVAGTANGFTDAVAAAILARVPLSLRADLSRFRWFMNAPALFTLQASRSTVNVATGSAKGVGGGGVFPDMPTSSQGIAIVPTDSLVSNERNGAHQ